ncbi:MAG: hypothetical protein JKZ00_00645 [Flavobacteriaceae bacterium]|nr:hypothetical protein [Flavobacteriaceae bacterium]
MLFPIIAAIVATIAVAYVIVKYLPLKLRWVPSIILLALAIFLGTKIYDGIMKPIKFNNDKTVFYSKVIKSLKIIRDAEIAYKEVTGKYTKDLEGLIQFIDTAQFAITNTSTIIVKVNKGTKWQPLIENVEKRVTDTIGYEPVIDKFIGRDYKNMHKVPGTDKVFLVEVGTIEKIAGLQVSVFEVKVAKDDVLVGLDPYLITLEKEAITKDQIKGAFISVGSLGEVTTGGNWPPSYDKADNAEKNNQ